MNEGDLLNVFNIIGPGLFTSLILNAVVVRKTNSYIFLLFEAFIYTIVVNKITELANSHIFHIKDLNSHVVYQCIPYSIAFIIALIIGFLLNKDLFHKAIRWCRITEKSFSSVWTDLLYNHKGYITVYLNSGRKIMGLVSAYSDDSNNGLLYLTSCSSINTENEQIEEEEIEGILIVNIKECDLIFFHKFKKSE